MLLEEGTTLTILLTRPLDHEDTPIHVNDTTPIIHVNDTTRWSCLEQHLLECVVNNSILYSEFVFSSSSIKVEFVTAFQNLNA